MKKNILLAIFAFAFSTLTFGQLKVFVPTQSFVSPLGVSIPNGDTVTVSGDTVSEMNVTLYLINPTGGANIIVLARRDSLNTPVAFDNAFCWGGLCFNDTTNVAPPAYSVSLSPGDTGSSPADYFQGHYYPDGYARAAYIRYDFFDKTNPANPDSAFVVVKYLATPTGIKNISGGEINFSALYPNPANTSVNFNYSLNNGVQAANLKIFNMLGECVQTLPLSALKNKTTINVQSMPSGIYICQIEANGCQPAYQKLIVSH